MKSIACCLRPEPPYDHPATRSWGSLGNSAEPSVQTAPCTTWSPGLAGCIFYHPSLVVGSHTEPSRENSHVGHLRVASGGPDLPPDGFHGIPRVCAAGFPQQPHTGTLPRPRYNTWPVHSPPHHRTAQGSIAVNRESQPFAPLYRARYVQAQLQIAKPRRSLARLIWLALAALSALLPRSGMSG